MRFGQTNPLKSARGKLGVGVALLLFGLAAMLAAPQLTDRLLCGLIPLLGVALMGLGFRQDRAEKDKIRRNLPSEKK